jgi:hypothetical protein
MRIRSLAAVLGVATALAGVQTATAYSEGDGASPPPPDGPSQADLPRFKPGFLNRVWRFNGSVDSVGDGALSMTLESIERLPKRFRTQDDELLDQDVTVLYSEHTRVYGPDGHLVHLGELERAESVQIRGRLLRPRKWRANEDGDYVPTVRAKRIHVTAWVPGSEPVPEDASSSEEDDEGPGEGCHHDAVLRDAEGVSPCW